MAQSPPRLWQTLLAICLSSSGTLIILHDLQCSLSSHFSWASLYQCINFIILLFTVLNQILEANEIVKSCMYFFTSVALRTWTSSIAQQWIWIVSTNMFTPNSFEDVVESFRVLISDYFIHRYIQSLAQYGAVRYRMLGAYRQMCWILGEMIPQFKRSDSWQQCTSLYIPSESDRSTLYISTLYVR